MAMYSGILGLGKLGREFLFTSITKSDGNITAIWDTHEIDEALQMLLFDKNTYHSNDAIQITISGNGFNIQYGNFYTFISYIQISAFDYNAYYEEITCGSLGVAYVFDCSGTYTADNIDDIVYSLRSGGAYGVVFAGTEELGLVDNYGIAYGLNQSSIMTYLQNSYHIIVAPTSLCATLFTLNGVQAGKYGSSIDKARVIDCHCNKIGRVGNDYLNPSLVDGVVLQFCPIGKTIAKIDNSYTNKVSSQRAYFPMNYGCLQTICLTTTSATDVESIRAAIKEYCEYDGHGYIEYYDDPLDFKTNSSGFFKGSRRIKVYGGLQNSTTLGNTEYFLNVGYDPITYMAEQCYSILYYIRTH